MKRFALAALLLLTAIGFASEGESPQQRSERLRWWREARFGMFIHWGPISIMGKEISWSRGGERRGIQGRGEIPVEIYDNLYKKFNPVEFNADEWVSIAKSAGMRYMVLTAKHCDGFCLWKSKVDPYSIAASPFGRDVCGELAQSAHGAGMKIGWYYSPMDWRDPDCRTERNDIYVKKMQGHLRELLGNYGKIDLLWFDSEGGPAHWHQRETYALVRSLQPSIIIDDRLGIGSGTPFDNLHPDENADYATPEQRVGAFNNQRPWETCMTLGTQWAWKPNDTIKTAQECIRILVQCVTGDGNLLLNVGPMPDGRIEPRQVEVLKQIGAWMGKYGESIYGTRGGPYRNGAWGGSTYKGSTVYLHILSWEDGRIVLPGLPVKVLNATLLTDGDVSISHSDKEIVVEQKAAGERVGDTIIRLDLERPLENFQVLSIPGRREFGNASLALAEQPTQPFNVHGSEVLIDGLKGSTDRLDGRWLGFLGSPFEAVIDFHVPRELSSISVGCLQEQVSRIFYPTAIEVSASDDGRSFHQIGKIDNGETQLDAEIRPHDFTVSFAPVTTRYLKVRALNRGTCPSWHEAAGSKSWLLVDEISLK